jgi:SAM-dependent methyltransferase
MVGSHWRDQIVGARNAVGMALRNGLSWSMPAWKKVAGSWQASERSFSPEAAKCFAELSRKYEIEQWPALLSQRELLESVYCLDVLDRFVPRKQDAKQALDVGSKNGTYLPALATWAAVPWRLVELDAHRRYADFSTRRAHGERMCRAFRGCQYVAGNVQQTEGCFDVITWFLPFVTKGPLLSWGLPLSEFQPRELLKHVAGLLAPGGVMLIVNQGENERDVQRSLLTEVSLPCEELGALQSSLSPFHKQRYGFLLKKG